MNYYEELGLNRTASAAEIRRSYRELARILHPDRHHRKGAQHLAQCQMKRLNNIVGILLDAERRDRYDQSIEPKRPERMAHPGTVLHLRREIRMPKLIWITAAIIGLSGILGYFLDDLRQKPLVRDSALEVLHQNTELDSSLTKQIGDLRLELRRLHQQCDSRRGQSQIHPAQHY